MPERPEVLAVAGPIDPRCSTAAAAAAGLSVGPVLAQPNSEPPGPMRLVRLVVVLWEGLPLPEAQDPSFLGLLVLGALSRYLGWAEDLLLESWDLGPEAAAQA